MGVGRGLGQVCQLPAEAAVDDRPVDCIVAGLRDFDLVLATAACGGLACGLVRNLASCGSVWNVAAGSPADRGLASAGAFVSGDGHVLFAHLRLWGVQRRRARRLAHAGALLRRQRRKRRWSLRVARRQLAELGRELDEDEQSDRPLDLHLVGARHDLLRHRGIRAALLHLLRPAAPGGAHGVRSRRLVRGLCNPLVRTTADSGAVPDLPLWYLVRDAAADGPHGAVSPLRRRRLLPSTRRLRHARCHRCRCLGCCRSHR
mmetsp:Transcript_141123/g.450793  ORF Transcript_141123/g.450793 Transcript_141123/m.450793 type:complete len:260 (-) Transcript_141123:357-1136(-)